MNLDKNKAREEAWAKFNLAKQRKREMVDKIEKRLKETYWSEPKIFRINNSRLKRAGSYSFCSPQSGKYVIKYKGGSVFLKFENQFTNYSFDDELKRSRK